MHGSGRGAGADATVFVEGFVCGAAAAMLIAHIASGLRDGGWEDEARPKCRGKVYQMKADPADILFPELPRSGVLDDE
ncbi:hypothetical protein [Bifidobacterium myosotis]|uniref:Uncharacterized protein n=1 Tax=Bifidobacterium myosotis TaxID=1630166 RepID=A0A5M9ZH71_9BIFI|nr:hypothetical protein [Bifidobacterium myosotis]KAA8826944.1 hypothetical protein EMO91_10460 [Bifidobacterium myosotis]